MKAVRRGMAVILLTFLLTGIPAAVNAQEDIRLMQTIEREDSLQIYVSNEKTVKSAVVQIGRDICENVEIRTAEQADTDIHTIFLLDNSLSITESNRQKIKSLLQSYISHKNQHEAISLYLFGEDGQALVEDSMDSAALEEAVEKITYINQDSWLTDVVYEEVKKRQEDKIYTRFVVISDGVDNKAIGYTEEELQLLLKETGFPLYAIGCVYKENQERLEHFFALSRRTAGKGFLLDNDEDMAEIENKILQDGNVPCIIVPIPEALKDGSEKSVLIKLETGNGTAELRTTAQMPFGKYRQTEGETGKETEIETETDSIVPSEAVEMAPEETETLQKPDQDMEVDWITIIATAAIVVAVIAFLVIRQQGRRKDSGQTTVKKKAFSEARPLPEVQISEKAEADGGETGFIDSGETHLMFDEGETQFMGCDAGTGSMDREVMLLRMQDMDRPEKVFQYPVFDEVLVGRAAEGNHIVLDYERSVSGRQCRICAKGDRIFVENLSNVNVTDLNGHKITRETQLHSGDILKLGRLRMRIELIRR